MAGKSAVVRVAIVGDNSSLKRALRDSQKGLRKFGGVARTLGGPGLALGMGVLAKQAIDVEAKFGKTMRTIAAVTNAPKKEIKALNDLAVDLGQNTIFSANEAAGAMLELSKAGVPTETILKSAADATLDLATAAGTDLSTAATIAANAMNAFDIPGKKLDKVTTALVGGANESTASVESLQQGLSQVGSGAVNAGLDFNETVAALSAFDNAGVKGSDAGTSLKVMLQRLVPQTDKAREAMKDLGLDFTDSEGNFKDLADISQELKDGLKGLSEEERTTKLQEIFGSDATRAASILGKEGKKGIDKYVKATKDKKAAERGAKAATEGTSGALEKMSSTIETAQLRLGQELAPAVEKAADWLGKHLVPAMDKAIDYGKLFLDTVKPLLGPLEGIAKAAQAVAKWIDKLPEPVKKFAIQAGLAAIALPKVHAAMKNINGVSGGFITNMKDSAKRVTLLKDAAKQAAGLAGIMLLTDGLTDASEEGVTFKGAMKAAAGGAGIGAMFGPIGTLIGTAGGLGLYGLTAAFSDTKDAAKLTRLELLKSEGLAQAKEDADTLSEALQGVVSSYGDVARAAIKGGFKDDSGALEADIVTLRDAGLSMDTIVSAAQGNPEALKRVGKAFRDNMGDLKTWRDEATAAYNDVKDGSRDYINAQGVLISEPIDAAGVKIYKDEMDRATKAVEDQTAARSTFNDRVEANTGVVRDHNKEMKELAKRLHIPVEQYKKWPSKVRTRFEEEGLPQLAKDAVRLIGNFKDLQTFARIKAVISAPGVDLTRKQINKLAEDYELNPVEIRALLKLEGIGTGKGKGKGDGGITETAKGYGKKFGTAWQQAVREGMTSTSDDLASQGAGGITRKFEQQVIPPFKKSVETGINDAKATAQTDGPKVGKALTKHVLLGASNLGPALSTAVVAAVNLAIADGVAAAGGGGGGGAWRGNQSPNPAPTKPTSQPSAVDALPDRTLSPRREANVNVYVGNEQVAAVVERRRVVTGRRTS